MKISILINLFYFTNTNESFCDFDPLQILSFMPVTNIQEFVTLH